ncbi:MAG: peptidoglycan DD-metalloendopeptidase family protein [Ornithinimicrobium sp.]|uniref:M23 family metallopeptidase n=1 Tax=Ornithinimicrobium sp. TaxID=1977084 RepID=UPI0026E0DE01|nr:M23 family metallopeptidase [Ornithinimicrobium sp.]MDO5741177.1 peptidoglycan DD-metalloendopeptidase family protein [Ornithinimicrobium sp.]
MSSQGFAARGVRGVALATACLLMTGLAGGGQSAAAAHQSHVAQQRQSAPTDGAALDAVGASALSAAVGLRTDRGVTSAWGWPLMGRPQIVNGFDLPSQRWLPGHRGIDLAGVIGEPVLAVDAGVVSFSGQIAGVGIISVTHSNGLRSTYQPVSERSPRGSRVGRGDLVGTLDLGGHCVLRSCLHLGAVRGKDAYVDPTPLLLDLELSLLPVTD